MTYVLLYGLVLWMLPLATGLAVAGLRQRGSPWRGDLLWTIDWQPVMFVGLGPIVAGFAAIDTVRLGVGVNHITEKRLVRSPSGAVLASYGLVLAGFQGLTLMVALVLSRPPSLPASAVVAYGAQVSVLLLCVAFGALVGRFAGLVLAGALSSLGALLAIYFASFRKPSMALLYLGVSTSPRVGYRYNVQYLLLQILLLGTFIFGLLLIRRQQGARFGVSPVWGAIGLVFVMMSLLGAHQYTAPRLIADRAPPTYCGSAQGVPVCMYREHARLSGVYTEKIWALIEAAKGAGYSGLIPAQIHEASATRLPSMVDPQTAPLIVSVESLQGATPGFGEIVMGLEQPLHCPQLGGDAYPSERYGSDLSALVATWVNLVEPGSWADSGMPGSPLSASEATQLAQDFRSCNYKYFH